MKIYTSYFANSKALQKAGVVMVGIALFPPRWFAGLTYKQVAPTYSILKQTSSDAEYTRRYKQEILARLNIAEFVAALEKMTGGKPVALCCFEKPTEFCHRHLLAEAMNAAGYEVEEFYPKPDPEQLTLQF